MQEQKIYGRREGAVGHLVFNNPAKLNAVSLDMWDAFVGILKDYAKDPEVRCVVVSGAGGKAFVSGADISKFETERANAMLAREPRVRSVLVRVHKPHAPLPGVVRDVFVEVRRDRA